ncbi:MAG: hypothetical protein A2Y62_11655 [Candidatus Fischerbacteria bacterium RBG_13_37_8]|uniref:ArnT-like N-terminal domain-containing protein n=1 Tax=Candidatus Fischerbacteria bacterium RBG_13_37_8 TaxID=1817863 RepID=A0A1F5VGM0_9BACT|nr:MAG: hypothetical protein A2Y62_11655 [Candidatus Fischerbacteria bacterium RBG_13_37_8]
MIFLKKKFLPFITGDSSYILIFLILWFPYIFNIWSYSIWDSNEAYYVEGPREMLESSDVLSPRFNYEYRFEKPILSYWMVLGFYKLFNMFLFSERFAIAFFALGSIILTFTISRTLFTSTEQITENKQPTATIALPYIPLLSASAFATSFKFFTLAHRSIIDIVLTFWILLAMHCYVKFISTRHKVFENSNNFLLKYDKGRTCYYGIFIAMALGVLTKGLLGLVVPASIILLHVIISRRFYLFKELRFYLGLLLFFAVALPWYIYMGYAHGIEYLSFFIIGNHFKLYMTGVYSLSRPFWYYIPNILGGFAPWTCFFPFMGYCLYHYYKNRQAQHNSLTFIIAWIGFILIFFSLSKGKQEEYILQIYPALSILLAWTIHYSYQHVASAHLKKWIRITVSIASIIFLLTGITFYLLNKGIFTSYHHLALFPVIFILLSILMICKFTDSEIKSTFYGVVIMVWLMYAVLIIFYLPVFEKEYKYVKYFAQTYQNTSNPDDAIGYYKVGIPSLVYYTKQKVHIFSNEDEIKNVMNQKRLFLIIDRRNFDAFDGSFREQFTIVQTQMQFPTTFKKFLHLTKGLGAEEVVMARSK